MPENNVAFVGSIPENYDRYLGPTFVQPYARELAERVSVSSGAHVLELASGTGILTRRLRDRLPADVSLTATDLNPPMMDYAATKFDAKGQVEWREVDATELPFADGSFDAVVCGFGVMFFPDKARAFAEAYRVLRSGGQILFSVWDSLEHNDLPRTGREVVNTFFENDPPTFYNVPFSFYDRDEIRSLLEAAGFTDIELTTLPKEATASSAADLTIGLIEGNPIITAINERIADKLPEIKAAVANTIRSKYGDDPVRGRMQAIICSARK